MKSIHANEVNGLDCPACGHPTLMLMSGGYITCCLADCPNPDYAEAAEQKLIESRIEAYKQALYDVGYGFAPIKELPSVEERLVKYKAQAHKEKA